MLTVFLIHGISKRDSEIANLSSVVSEKNDSVSYYRNSSDRAVAEKLAAQLEANQLKKIYPEIHRSLSKDFDIRVRDLKAYMESKFTAFGSGDSEVHYHYHPDTKSTTIDVISSDGYLDYKGTVIDSSRSTFSYTYSDTIKQTISTRKSWVFGDEKLYGSAVLSNPNAKVTGSKSVLMTEYKDKRWGIGVGLFYSGNVAIGVGIQYNLIKF